MAIRKVFLRLILITLFSAAFTKSPAQIANTLSAADKIYGLSKFWQEVNYNFVYLNKIGPAAWDSAYRAFIPQVQATQNDYEYYHLLQKFCALLKDGHTEISFPSIAGFNYMFNTFGDYLLVLKRVDNKVIIKRTWQKDLAQFPLGSEVIEVSGQPTEAYIRDSVAPYISSSTEAVRIEMASDRLLGGFAGSVFHIKIRKPDGQEAVYSLTHAKANQSIFAPQLGDYLDEKQRDLLEFKMLEKGIAYVGLNSFSLDHRIDTAFIKLLPTLYTARGVVIDLRYNGGGDDGVAFNILKYFIQDSIIHGAAAVGRTYNSYQKAIGGYVKTADTSGNANKKDAWLFYHGYAVYGEPGLIQSRIEKGLKKVSVPVAILTGSNTESAAEDFVIASNNQKHMTKIGEATNGSTGQPYLFDLPGGAKARICVMKNMFPDGREFVGYGIQPDIKISPAVKDYLENKDVVLDAAVKYLTKAKP